MSITLSPLAGAGAQFFDDNGDPLAGGYLYTYAAGTTTPATTWTSSSGATANANPIVLDAAGRVPAEIWITIGTAYKFVLKNTVFTEIWTKDNIQVYVPADPTANLATCANPALGDALVAFRQSNSSGNLAGAVCRTVHQKLQEIVSVLDFGADPTGATDSSAAIVAATASGRQVNFPAGTYLLESQITLGGVTGLEWRGAGRDVTTIKFDPNANWTGVGVLFSGCNDVTISGITFEQTGAVLTDAGVQMSAHTADSDDITIRDCAFLNSYFIGLSLWRNRRFEVLNNVFSRRASMLDSSQHYCLNASCLEPDGSGGFLQTGTVLSNGLIFGNKLYDSGMSVAGWQIEIANNSCEATSYGACIATYDRPVATSSLSASWILGSYSVHNNICSGGVGVDADGYEVAGLEIGGPYSTCIGNISYNNAGQGIRWFGYQGVCANNVCYNNGTAGGSAYGAYTQAGITAYITATFAPTPARTHYSARYSLIANNICFDTGAGNQLYGYSENSPVSDLLVGMNVTGNKVTENVTGTGYLINSAVDNSYDFDQWDTYNPTAVASTGAITTYASTGRYMRRGGVTFVNITITLTDNGTGAGYITVSLPVNSINDTALGRAALPGYNSGTGKSLVGLVDPNASTFILRLYDNTYPGATGHTLTISGWYVTSAVG